MSDQEHLILGLDLSTSCTGYALFAAGSKALVAYGNLKPKVPGKSKMSKLDRTLETMLDLASQIQQLVVQYNPRRIVIEEITGSKNRLGQKTLDGYHWIVLFTLRTLLDKIVFYDVTGTDGWRQHLRLVLSDSDKEHNKEARRLNKTMAKSHKEIPIIGPKHLACRFVNARYNKTFDVDVSKTDADMADAIAMTHAFVTLRPKEI